MRIVTDTTCWARYTYFRLLGQSFGAIPLVLEALRALRPHVFVGT